MSPALLSLVALAVFGVAAKVARWPLPAALAAAALVAGVAGTGELPFRHFVEGGFGFLNLILALFAGAWFAATMREGGYADSVARLMLRATGGRPVATLAVVGALCLAVGMATGIAGVAVLVIGAFARPILAAIGLEPHRAAAFVAIEATCGMIAPPINVPAMMIADGVNMPFLNFERTLVVIAAPVALAAIALFARGCARPVAAPRAVEPMRWRGVVPLAMVLGFWLALRSAPAAIFDPGVPIVLVAAALVATPALDRGARRAALAGTFTGVPLLLAAALVAVGILVQTMTLTGMRGWVVMQTLASQAPWLHLLAVGLPVVGGVLTAAGAANVLGVPFAFAFIEQDMIVNVAAFGAIASIAEFMPPTAISAALAGYLFGAPSLWQICKAALPAILLIFAIGLALIVWAKPLAPWLTGP